MEGIPPEDDEPRAKQRALEPSFIPTPAMPPMPPGAGPFGVMMPPYGVPMPAYGMPGMAPNIPMPSGPVPIPLPTGPPVGMQPVTSIPIPAVANPQPPPTPTFPAYQQSAVKDEPVPGSNGAGDAAAGSSKPLSSRTRIVCPDETISLVCLLKLS